ncbi:MAG: hypothetical protein GY793_03870 [Proteobacteria bacterium]|nr:hypothetical protein [Pseudomonadota bacterium]
MENKTIKQEGQKKDNNYLFAELCIGEGSDKYIEIFKRITKGHFIVPSIPAGIFGLAWLSYRKAARYGFSFYILSVVLLYMLIADMESLSTALKMIIIFGASHIIFFFIANFLYWACIRRKIDSCRKTYGDVNAMTCLSDQGGTLKPFGLIASVLAVQGSVMLTVYVLLSVDSFFGSLLGSIQELIKV